MNTIATFPTLSSLVTEDLLPKLRSTPGVIEAYISQPRSSDGGLTLDSTPGAPSEASLPYHAMTLALSAGRAFPAEEQAHFVRILFGNGQQRYLMVLFRKGYLVCAVVQAHHPIGKSLKRTLMRITNRLSKVGTPAGSRGRPRPLAVESTTSPG